MRGCSASSRPLPSPVDVELGGRAPGSALLGRRSPPTSRTASKSPCEAIGKAGLENVHAQPVKLARHLQLLLQVHAAAGRLLAVAQGRVEDADVVVAVADCGVTS